MSYAIARLNILASGSQILRLGEECYRFKLKRQSEAIPQIFNLKYSIPAWPGWGYLSFVVHDGWKSKLINWIEIALDLEYFQGALKGADGNIHPLKQCGKWIRNRAVSLILLSSRP